MILLMREYTTLAGRNNHQEWICSGMGVRGRGAELFMGQ